MEKLFAEISEGFPWNVSFILLQSALNFSLIPFILRGPSVVLGFRYKRSCED